MNTALVPILVWSFLIGIPLLGILNLLHSVHLIRLPKPLLQSYGWIVVMSILLELIAWIWWAIVGMPTG